MFKAFQCDCGISFKFLKTLKSEKKMFFCCENGRRNKKNWCFEIGKRSTMLCLHLNESWNYFYVFFLSSKVDIVKRILWNWKKLCSLEWKFIWFWSQGYCTDSHTFCVWRRIWTMYFYPQYANLPLHSSIFNIKWIYSLINLYACTSLKALFQTASEYSFFPK